MAVLKLVSAIVAIATLLSSVAGCSGNSDASTPPATTPAFQIPSTYTTYTDETSLFSVSYPSQWEPVPNPADILTDVKDAIDRVKSGLPVDKVSILYMAGLKDTSSYVPSLNVLVEPVPSGLANIDQIASAEVTGLKRVVADYQEVSRTKTVVNARAVVMIEYKGHVLSDGPVFHNLILLALSGKTVWALTLTATDDIFSQWADDFNNVARSFKITA